MNPAIAASTAVLSTLLLTACGGGGGGGGDDRSGAFAVTATRAAGGASNIHTVCIEGIAYYDPATTQGQDITRTLMAYYGLSGASQSLANSDKTCRELVPGVDTIVDIDGYNRVVVPGAAAILSGPPTPSGGGGGGGTGGTGGGGGGGGAGTPTFITWTDNRNGEVVLDADNERFAFTADTRCIYSYNRKEVTSNFCLDGAARATGSLASLRFQVLSVAGVAGGCLAGLADLSGNQIDIFTDASGRQVARALGTAWDTSGCTR